MKCQYESEILFKLMERDGFNIPSSVPPYEAEIKAYLINQVKQAYPKLTDYEAEWLLYNYTKHLPAEFPISSVSDVTEATFENVVPFAYQSAILNGNTFVNLSENLETITKSLIGWYNEAKLMNNIDKLKRNTYYTILYRLENISGNHQNYDEISLGIGVDNFNKDLFSNITSIVDKNGGWCKCRFQLTDDFIEQNPTYKQLYIRPIRRKIPPVEGESINYTIRGFVILEGDYITNPIPFNEVFGGMQSVQMRVLTTTGKNLFDMNAIVQDEFELNKYQTGYYGKEFTLQPNTTYTIKAYLREDITNTSVWTVFNVLIQGEVFNVLNVDKTGKSGQNAINQMTFTTDSTGKVRYSIYSHLNSRVSWLGNLPFNIQLEKGTTETSYEPYQSNILSATGKNTFNIKNAGDNKAGWYSIPLESSFSGEIYIKIAESLPSDFRVNIIANNTENHILNSQLKNGYTDKFQNVTSIGFHCPSLLIMDDLRGNLDDLIANKNIMIKLYGDVTLRGIGDVKDTLDCLTGEVVERIGESNSENFVNCSYSSTIFNGYYAAIINLNNKASSSVIMTNLVPTQGFTDGLDCGIYNNPGNVVLFKKGATLEEITNLVSNLVIQYELAEPIVKTVDLTTVNEKGETTYFMPLEGTMHVQSSGEIIQPTFDMSVPVEATTQNLASFIELEME